MTDWLYTPKSPEEYAAMMADFERCQTEKERDHPEDPAVRMVGSLFRCLKHRDANLAEARAEIERLTSEASSVAAAEDRAMKARARAEEWHQESVRLSRDVARMRVERGQAQREVAELRARLAEALPCACADSRQGWPCECKAKGKRARLAEGGSR